MQKRLLQHFVVKRPKSVPLDNGKIMNELSEPLKSIYQKLIEPQKPFTLLVQAQIQTGMIEKFNSYAEAAEKGTRQEPGNLAYKFHRALDDPHHIFLFEKWENFDSLVAHFQKSYTVDILKIYEELSVSPLQLEVFQHLN